MTVAWSKKDIKPNGLWPARDGSILVVGFLAADKPRGVHAMGRGGELKALATGFKGPADFCVMGETVYVPDLVASQLRIIKLGR